MRIRTCCLLLICLAVGFLGATLINLSGSRNPDQSLALQVTEPREHVGEQAIDFELPYVGKEGVFRLSDAMKDRHVALLFGSST